MGYRVTRKRAEMLAKMREAKEIKRIMGDAPIYPPLLPDLRRTIIVIDYDSGLPEHHQIDLYKTGRIDQYRAVVDGIEWKKRIGFSGVLAGIRKAMPRIVSAQGA